ncbi:MAG: ABC transporter substrate-binding protein [Bacillota bacterium]
MRKKGLLVTIVALTMILTMTTATMAGFFDWLTGSDSEQTVLTVYSAYGGEDEIYSAFEEDTGIRVEYIDMSSGEVLARLRGEKQSNSNADIWFGGGSDAFITAKKEGLLAQYKSPEAENIRDLFKDKDGYWTGVSLVTVNFIVNTEICKEKGIEVPQTWADVAKSEYQDEVLMSNPSISGTAYTILSGLLQHKGAEAGWNYFDKLNDNIPYYAKRGSEPPKKAALGEVIVGLSPGTGVDLKEQGYPIVSIMPKDGVPWWPAPMAILKQTDNLEAAKKFVDWALSARGQKVLRDNCPRVPTRDGIEPPEALSGFKDAEIMDVDFEEAGAQRDKLVNKWKEDYYDTK